MHSLRVLVFLMAVCACSTLSGLAYGKAVGSESNRMKTMALSGSDASMLNLTVLAQLKDHHSPVLWIGIPVLDRHTGPHVLS